MSVPSDADLATFIATSAVMLDLKLDEQALAAVRDAMRAVASQAKLVLDYPAAPAAT